MISGEQVTTGQPYIVKFGEFGMSFRVSTKREFLPNGAPFEGVGVKPSQPIPLETADVTATRDLQLDRAVSQLLHNR